MAVATGTALLIGGGLAAAGGIGSALIQGEASRDAARSQQRSIREAQGIQEQGFQRGQEFQQPFLERGGQAFQTLADLAQQGVAQQPQQIQQDFTSQIPALQQFSMSDLQADPGIQFAQEQAQRAALAAGGAQGRRFGGGTLRELQRNAAGLAGQQTQQAFNRFAGQQQLNLSGTNQLFNQGLLGRQQQVGEQQQAFGNLRGISNVGVNAATNLGNLAIGQAGTLADLSLQSGNVEAARQIGQGRAIGGALQSGAGGLQDLILQQQVLGGR